MATNKKLVIIARGGHAMTTEEAISKLDELRPEWEHLPDDLREAISVTLAELARVTRERDRLIEAWPEYNGTATPDRLVRSQDDGVMPHDWASDGGSVWLWHHDTKEQAVRAAAGLDAMEGMP